MTKSKPIAVIDLESTGLSFVKDRILEVGLIDEENGYQLVTMNIDKLKDYRLVGHNIKFDVGFINAAFKTDLKPYLDTMILYYLIKPYRRKYGLKDILTKDFKIPEWNEDTLGLRNEQGKVAKAIAETLHYFRAHNFIQTEVGKKLYANMLEYLKLDVTYTYGLFQFCIKKLTPEEISLAELLTQVDFLIQEKYEPFYLNQEKLEETYHKINNRMLELERRLSKGGKLNLNSSRQVVQFITKQMGLEIHIKTEKGALSVGVDSIQDLAERYPSNSWITDFSEYKTYSKLLRAFLKPWMELEGSFKPSFSLVSTKSGRTSCMRPNIQQIPKGEIRQLFIPPKGYDFVEVDYSQMELRIVADVAQVKPMLEAFEQGKDMHTLTTQLLFHKEDVSESERKIGKTANFALLYGMSPKGFAGFCKGMDVSLAEANRIHANFHNAYRELNKYYDIVKHDLQTKHYSENKIGRRYRFDVREYNLNRSYVERSAINAKVQSLASDMLLIALRDLLNDERYGKDFYICGTVHDSILAYVKKGVDLEDLFYDRMCAQFEGSLVNVKLKIDYENFGDSWQ